MFNYKIIDYLLIPIILSIIIIIIKNDLFETIVSNQCSVNVFIAILSQRNHFNRRQTLRQTWIQTINDINRNNSLIDSNGDNCRLNLNAKFIIGDKDCPIHPILRTDVYSCRLNDIQINENNSEINLFEFNSIEEQFVFHKTIFRGFSFLIRHQILITKIGIHKNFLSKDTNITICLLNAQNKEIIKNIEISFKSFGSNHVFYEDIEPLVLAKNFYGLLIIDNQLLEFNYKYDSNVTLNQNGFIHILRAYYGFTDYESVSYNSNQIIGPILVFKASDQKSLEFLKQSINDFQNKWKTQLLATEENLSKEILINNDIILTNSVEVYRNLAEKVIQSIQFAIKTQVLTHYLKTDDDCYLNVINIMNELIPNKHLNKVWFGNFRRLWSTDRWGKWLENDFESPLYPPFACGSGYILSSDLVEWIASNINHLHRFQGEDVSMGIWMAAINPLLIDDKRWVCTETELNLSQTFSFPQLEEKQILKIHKFIENITIQTNDKTKNDL